jgi:hypothetical protein
MGRSIPFSLGEFLIEGPLLPIADVEFTDVPNHVNCTARQSQPQRGSIGRFL